MSSQLGPLEIDCDAPPYRIVEACEQIGMVSPEDVRWCRMSRFRKEFGNRREFPSSHPWKWLLGNQPAENTCTCGQALPRLDRCTFTLLSGKELHYLMGQCSRCRTIFWEET